MTDKTFEAQGEIKGKEESRKFTKVVSAVNKNMAEHKIRAMFGSKNRIKAKHVLIKQIKEIKE